MTTMVKGRFVSIKVNDMMADAGFKYKVEGDWQILDRVDPLDDMPEVSGNRSLPSYRAESLDGGLTWSQPKPCGILNNESKLDVISWDEETILMAYNDTPETDWHRNDQYQN